MPFWPWSLLGLRCRAYAAGSIVVLIARLFNGHRLYVCIHPSVQLEAVEANALLADGKLTDIGPDGVLEFFLAHAEVAGRFTDPENSRQ
ncbi:hypothetical protein D3C76_1236280 [compost metagenome]